MGDSQAVLCSRGEAVPVTRSHRVYGSGPDVEQEIRRVFDTGGWVHKGRVLGVIAVSRSLGDARRERPPGLGQPGVRGP